ncbi:iron-sulfur cluster biosynthesis family protein [Geobacillus sp. G4]|uniref:Heme biosynthesis protein HemY n=6 Tax=Geobacillus TaxID=129337 RepID=A0A7U9JCS4_GEOTM|nr:MULTISPECIES: iron-sulfur cluster biosynthesis family protein [Geobacillus]AEV19926.1 HesB/YadR/YfhF family protein [Geobacillus thermoleovorans CCB_US3_UF5]AMV11465.1 heme biosynthesis protein HemY [Geobacillus thermoleovorans]AOL35071.1 heme biosynthesis protein HemY [Geobacillus thermoleovorans]AUI37972.1 iron-sulfur cluster biosynthesis family protein [[Bacillus] caldolyticus]AWO75532.1 iron-sulfur cluster biosynthesis family protein [Geobacillus thermoleovorans]
MSLYITFTDAAKRALASIVAESGRQLKLMFDTDGCGCLVDGVPALWLVDKADEDDVVVETNFAPVLVERSRLIFFDETMTIDVKPGTTVFQLKSPGQTLNGHMPFVEVKSGHER